VADPEDQNQQDFVLDSAHNAVLSDPVPPEPYLISCEGFSQVARIMVASNAFLQKPDNALLRWPRQLLEIFQSPRFKSNRPNQAA
jgi:hypothetical protein